MNLRQLIVGAGITVLSSVGVSAQASPQSAPIQMASDYLDAEDWDNGFQQYVDLLTPVVIRTFRAQRPGLSDSCWQTVGGAIRSAMLAHKADIKLITAKAFARQFTDAELEQLSAFASSELGKDYRKAMEDNISRVAEHPSYAKPFVSGVQKAISDQSPDDADKRFSTVLATLKTRMPEREISQLSDFFYNGVGKKYVEVTPAINSEAIVAEAGIMRSEIPAITKTIAESESCK